MEGGGRSEGRSEGRSGSISGGGFTESLLMTKYGWSSERFNIVLNPLLYEGIVWVDDQQQASIGVSVGASFEKSYEFPTVSMDMVTETEN